MIMLKQCFGFIAITTLAACASTSQPTEIQAAAPISPVAASETTTSAVAVQVASEPVATEQLVSLPYPKLDHQEQIDELTFQINRLKQQVEQMNTRIRQLEQRNVPVARPSVPQPKPKLKPKTQSQVSLSAPLVQPIELTNKDSVQAAKISPLEQAQKFYAQGNYRAVLEQLRGDDGGGDGSQEAQQKMWLLLQSNNKLQKCQSVIHIGQRFVSRFASHAHAPEALFIVGQCQWSIQQQDIARDTWRDLIRRYPSSPFVAQATQAIKRPK